MCAYQDCETDKNNIRKEISRLRESWRSCLKLASICVHYDGVSASRDFPIFTVCAHESMCRRWFPDQDRLSRMGRRTAITVGAVSIRSVDGISHSILRGSFRRPGWREWRLRQPETYTTSASAINSGKRRYSTYLEIGGAAQNTSIADMMNIKGWLCDNEVCGFKDQDGVGIRNRVLLKDSSVKNRLNFSARSHRWRPAFQKPRPKYFRPCEFFRQVC